MLNGWAAPSNGSRLAVSGWPNQIASYGGSGGSAINTIGSADCEVCESQSREKLHKILQFLHIHKCIFVTAVPMPLVGNVVTVVNVGSG